MGAGSDRGQCEEQRGAQPTGSSTRSAGGRLGPHRTFPGARSPISPRPEGLFADRAGMVAPEGSSSRSRVFTGTWMTSPSRVYASPSPRHDEAAIASGEATGETSTIPIEQRPR